MTGREVEYVCSKDDLRLPWLQYGTRGVIKHVYSAASPYDYAVLFRGQSVEIAMKQDELWII